MFEVSIDFEGLDEAIAAYRDLEHLDFRTTFESFFQRHFQTTLQQRYIRAAAETPYARASLGTRKEYTRVLRGGPGDPGFGVDSRSLLRDLTGEGGNYKATQNTLELFSDLHYAERVHDLFALKGPYDQGILFANEGDLDNLEERLLIEIEQVFEA